MMNPIKKLKNKNYVMTIEVRTDDLKMPIFIPIPLVLVEDIMCSIDSIYRFAVRFIPNLKKFNKFSFGDYQLDLTYISHFSQEFFNELRNIGSFKLVEVIDKDTYVCIKIK